MARRKRKTSEDLQDLNLTPIMNLVMILIPAMVLSSVFMTAGVINISSPRNAQSTTPETEQQEERTQIPRLVVYVSADGFRVGNMNPQLPAGAFDTYASPIEGCAGAGGANAGAAATDPNDLANRAATICTLPNTDGQSLVDRLDYASLYNQLVRIRLNPEWFDEFAKENNAVISIVGDPEVPFESLVKVMDVARYVLNPSDGELEAPSASANLANYLLGAGTRPTREQLESAKYMGTMAARVDLFPNPVLLLPRPQGS